MIELASSQDSVRKGMMEGSSERLERRVAVDARARSNFEFTGSCSRNTVNTWIVC